MAYEIPLLSVGTLKAGADLSAAANQYRFVKLDANGDVVVCTADTDKPAGVLLNTPKLGQAAEVGVVGVYRVQGDGNLAKNDAIGPSADGQAAARTYGTDTTKFVGGTVLEDNTAAGGYCTAFINCANPHRAA